MTEASDGPGPGSAPLATYHWRQKVLFKHCDPAGIVFYPRYFEMINDCVEAFFADVLNWPFEEIHPAGAVPTAAIDVDFSAPGRHGELLEFDLQVTHLGRTSMALSFAASVGAQNRFQGHSTLVYIDDAGQPQPWPAALRSALGTEKAKRT